MPLSGETHPFCAYPVAHTRVCQLHVGAFVWHIYQAVCMSLGFPSASDGKESNCNAGDLGSIPGSGSSPGGGHGNPLQYSFLENPTDRRIWWPTVHGVTESDTTEQVTQFREPNTLLGSGDCNCGEQGSYGFTASKNLGTRRAEELITVTTAAYALAILLAGWAAL